MSINTRKNSNYIPSGPPFDLLYSERVGVDMGMPLPKRHLNLKFRGNRFIKCGELLKPSKLLKYPIIDFESNPDEYNTVIMTDLDAPNRYEHFERERLQYLVVNIPGSEVRRGNLVVDYMPPLPTKQSYAWDGKHRICCYVFRQQSKMRCKHTRIGHRTAEGRAGFSMREFQETYNLDDPCYGTMFFSEFDRNIPLMLAKLTDRFERHKF